MRSHETSWTLNGKQQEALALLPSGARQGGGSAELCIRVCVASQRLIDAKQRDFAASLFRENESGIWQFASEDSCRGESATEKEFRTTQQQVLKTLQTLRLSNH